MKKMTQSEFNAIPRDVKGWKNCPGNTDYSSIKNFGEGASFGAGAVFGAWASFGKGARFGTWASFGEGAVFGEGARFGAWASFGEGAVFGKGCLLENTKKLIGNTVYSTSGFGSKNRTTYGIPTAKTVYVRCGCWFGSLMEFRARIAEVYAESPILVEYGLVADLFEARWNRERAGMA